MGNILPIDMMIALAGTDNTAPAYQTDGASGLDLRSAEDRTIAVDATVVVSTGVAVAVPPGHEAQVRPRSSLSAVGILVHLGTIDADYRGEVKVIVTNLSGRPFVIVDGARIAQLVVAPVTRVRLVEVPTLPPTDRGSGGFGSTGSK